MNQYTMIVAGGLFTVIAGMKINEVRNSYKSRLNSISSTKVDSLYEELTEVKSGNIISVRKIWGKNSNDIVVLFHGLGTSSNSLMLLAKEINEQTGAMVILPDRAGYRNSRVGSRGYYTIRESVDDIVEIIRLNIDNPENRNISLIGHSLGGYISYLVAQELQWPSISSILIEPTHPQEAINSKSKRNGVLNLSESISTNTALMGLGAYVLKGTDGISDIFTTATEDNPFIDEIRAEQVIGQTWRAMKREWGFIAPWMLNGTTQVNNNKFRTSVIISQETSNALVCEGQERLVQDYTGNEENIYLLKDSNHLSLILDKPCVEFIVQVYKGINND